jgi:hypothetical protein
MAGGDTVDSIGRIAAFHFQSSRFKQESAAFSRPDSRITAGCIGARSTLPSALDTRLQPGWHRCLLARA